jgi:hypothetical protein
VAYAVYLVRDDGTRGPVQEFGDLGDAARHAIRLADELGERPADESSSPPRKVNVHSGDRLEISILIMRGGLLGHRGFPKLRSM